MQLENEKNIQLIKAKEAAKLLSVSERTLWTLTNEGKIPCIRLGKSVRYNVQSLIYMVSQLEATKE